MNVGVKVQENWVISNLSLQIEKGKLYCFVSTDKSTVSMVLKLISGQIKPTSGKIYIKGKPLIAGKLVSLYSHL